MRKVQAGFQIAVVSVTLACSDGAVSLPSIAAMPLDRSHSEAMIDATRAGELALLWARQFGPFSRSFIETGFGRPIRFNDLTIGQPVYFAESPYRELGAEYSGAVRKAAGPHWIVNLLQDGVPALAVSVSALNTDLDVQNGRIVLPRLAGNEFSFLGIRAGHQFPLALQSAREAVMRETGMNVENNPVLVSPGLHDWLPMYSRWRFTLPEPIGGVTGEASPRRLATRVLYVDHRGKLLLQSEYSSASPIWLPLSAEGKDQDFRVLPVRSGLSTRFAEFKTIR